MTTTPDFRALCAELVDEIEGWIAYGDEADCADAHAVVDRARAALATPPPEPPTDEKLDELAWNWYSKTGSTWWQIESYRAFARAVLERWGNYPAIPDSSIQVSPPEPPTDEEILELMPETMQDEFSYAAKVCSDATGGKVKPGIFRVVLNTTALDFARAVLKRWGK